MREKDSGQVGSARVPTRVCRFLIDHSYTADFIDWEKFFEGHLVHPEDVGPPWEEEPAFDYDGEICFRETFEGFLNVYKPGAKPLPDEFEDKQASYIRIYKHVEDGIIDVGYSNYQGIFKASKSMKQTTIHSFETNFFAASRAMNKANIRLSDTYAAKPVRIIIREARLLLNILQDDVIKGSKNYPLISGQITFYEVK